MATGKTAQEFVPIKEVRDGIVTLKDNGLRAILLVSSLNFGLKSAEEQQSIIYQFQNFLNSLDFPVQIFVQSRKLDIRPYMAILEQRYREQINDLLKIQVREYIEFIRNFTSSSNIMSKSFFVVIPYTPTVLSTSSGLSSLVPGGNSSKDKAGIVNDNFENSRAQIEQRMAVVSGGLSRCGLRAVPLGTEEVIELYYKFFNPGDTEKPIPIGTTA